MPSAPDNPKGFWESTKLMDLNDRILASAGTSWNDWRPFNPDWYLTPLVDTFKGEAASTLMQEFGDNPLFVIKDPRICRFLPFWMDVLHENGVDIKIVIPVRNPTEVAMSLSTRNGMSPNAGLLLWLRHVLDAEHFSRTRDRVVLLWDDFLSHPTKSIRKLSDDLNIRWPRHRDFANVDVKHFISKDLKRQHESAEDAQSIATDLTDEAFELLRNLAHQTDAASTSRLDELRSRLDTATEILGPLFAPAERSLQERNLQVTNQRWSAGSLLAATRTEIPTTDPTSELQELREKLAQAERECEEASSTATNRIEEITAIARTQAEEQKQQFLASLTELQRQQQIERERWEALLTQTEERERAAKLELHQAKHQSIAEMQSARSQHEQTVLQYSNRLAETAHHASELLAEKQAATHASNIQLQALTNSYQQRIDALDRNSQEIERKASAELAEHRKTINGLLRQIEQNRDTHAAELSRVEQSMATAHQLHIDKITQTAVASMTRASNLIREYAHRLEERYEASKKYEQTQSELLEQVVPDISQPSALDKQSPWSDALARRLMIKGLRQVQRLGAVRLVWLGNRANRRRDWPTAASFYARALRTSPSMAGVWVQFGHALKESGRTALAEVAYRRALKLDPYNPDTHLQMGHLLKILGRTDAARTAYQRAVDINPSQRDASTEIASLPAPAHRPTLGTLDDSIMELIALSSDTTPPNPTTTQPPSSAGTPSFDTWPPGLHNDYWLPQSLRDFIVEKYGESHAALYRYLMAVVDRYGSDSEAFTQSPDARYLVERAIQRAGQVSAEPEASIIIPAYNNLALTLTCIVSILELPDHSTFEVIVGDDCSTDATAELLTRIGGRVRILRHPKNLGFLGNCNETAGSAHGRHVIMLNNDTLVFPGWLDQLLAPFARDDKIGLTGSMLLNGDGTLQEAGGIFWQDGSAWNYGRNQDPRLPEFNYAKEVDYISGASIALPTRIWKELGGFDPHFAPAYCEDSDLAFRVRERDLKVWYEPRSRLIHHEGRSHGRDTSSGIKAYQLANQKKFIARWSHVLERAHFPNAQNVLQARDRSRHKPRILVIDHYVPQKDRDAGSRTMFMYMKIMVDAGFHVVFWPDNLNEDVEYTPAIQSLGVEIQYFTKHACPQFDEFLNASGDTLKYVLLARPHVAIKYISSIRARTSARILFYGVDLHFLRLETRYKLEPSAELKSEIMRTREMELSACRQCDVVYYPGTEEVRYLRPLLPASLSLQEFPIFFFDDATLAAARKAVLGISTRNSLEILFVGGFNHTPNIDGICWFVGSVFPLLNNLVPGIHLHIVGSNAPPEVTKLSSQKITVHGRLSDAKLDELYTTVDASVVPLRYGGGVKGKVIEAMAKGVPVVTTDIGAQGISNAEACTFLANDPDNLARMIQMCLTDRRMAQAKATEALEFIRQKYSIDAARALLSIDIPELRA
jgi:GT2 family glycosyltransferase